MENEYRMFWSLCGVLCGPILISAKDDNDAKEIVRRVMDFQKSIFPKGESKVISLHRIEKHEEIKEIKIT